METPIIPTAETMLHLTMMHCIPDDLLQDIIDNAKSGKRELVAMDDGQFTNEVLWALQGLGYSIYHDKKWPKDYTIRW